MEFLAIVAVVFALLPVVFALPPSLHRTIDLVEWGIVGIFAVEYVVGLLDAGAAAGSAGSRGSLRRACRGAPGIGVARSGPSGRKAHPHLPSHGREGGGFVGEIPGGSLDPGTADRCRTTLDAVGGS